LTRLPHFARRQRSSTVPYVKRFIDHFGGALAPILERRHNPWKLLGYDQNPNLFIGKIDMCIISDILVVVVYTGNILAIY
jgi:glucosamine 6-phosphate synthetase-like amidotransferase/phosphosugar isomerase protein